VKQGELGGMLEGRDTIWGTNFGRRGKKEMRAKWRKANGSVEMKEI